MACAESFTWHNTRSVMLKCWNYPTNQDNPPLQGRLHGIQNLPFDSNRKRICTIVTSKHKPVTTLKSSRMESRKAILATYVACAGLLNWHKTKCGTLEICDYLTNSQKILFSHLGNRKTHVTHLSPPNRRYLSSSAPHY